MTTPAQTIARTFRQVPPRGAGRSPSLDGGSALVMSDAAAKALSRGGAFKCI